MSEEEVRKLRLESAKQALKDAKAWQFGGKKKAASKKHKGRTRKR